MQPIKDDPYPYANTIAARLLADGIGEASAQRGQSLRSIAKDLGYRQAAVLSHMATGRVPVPLERAVEIAKAVRINPGEFVLAVVGQKAPTAREWLDAEVNSPIRLPSPATVGVHQFANFDDMLGFAAGNLNDEQIRVMREVALDHRPGRRWLSPHELPVMSAIRHAIPDVGGVGMSAELLRRIGRVLSEWKDSCA